MHNGPMIRHSWLEIDVTAGQSLALGYFSCSNAKNMRARRHQCSSNNPHKSVRCHLTAPPRLFRGVSLHKLVLESEHSAQRLAAVQHVERLVYLRASDACVQQDDDSMQPALAPVSQGGEPDLSSLKCRAMLTDSTRKVNAEVCRRRWQAAPGRTAARE